MQQRLAALAALGLTLVTACGGTLVAKTTAPPSATTPTAWPATTAQPSAAPTATPTVRPKPSSTPVPATPADPAQADLDDLLAALDRLHPDAFHGIERDEWVAQLDALRAALPTLGPYQAEVELQRVVALLSRAGRDGHEFALPIRDELALPFQSYEFAEGVFITRALTDYGDLAGAQLLAVNGHPIDEVLDLLEPLIPRDGPATVPAFRPIYFHRISVLRGLGIIDEEPFPVTVGDQAGSRHDVTIEPAPFASYAALVGDSGVGLPPNGTTYLSAPGPTLWWQDLPDIDAFYIRYEHVASIELSDIDEILAGATAPGVDKVILDLRQNPGGDNHFYLPLLMALSDPRIDQPGRLNVLTDRRTFSAASNFATDLEQNTTAIFAGEPMGGGLNFWADTHQVELDHYPIPMRVGVSTRYWQKSSADDPRLTIDPLIKLPVTAADYFAGRDPVLEAVGGD